MSQYTEMTSNNHIHFVLFCLWQNVITICLEKTASRNVATAQIHPTAILSTDPVKLDVIKAFKVHSVMMVGTLIKDDNYCCMLYKTGCKQHLKLISCCLLLYWLSLTLFTWKWTLILKFYKIVLFYRVYQRSVWV